MHDSPSLFNAPADAAYNEKIRLLTQIRCDLPHYRDMLNFFEPVIKEREEYKQALISGLNIHMDEDLIYDLRLREGLPLLTKSDIIDDNPIMNQYFIKLLNIIKTQAASKLSAAETLIQQTENFSFEALIGQNFSKARSVPDDIMIEFLIDETVGPLLELYAREIKFRFNLNRWSQRFCPVCGKNPVFALSKETDDKKILVCSLCSFEWEFTRLACTHCGNTDQELLSYLSIDNDPVYRIETCDACRCYLKTIDLKTATHPISYDIESIITLHLDIIARNRGYSITCPPPPAADEDRLCQCA